jgi:two-component system, LuxR family, response regulator FixJ
MSTPATERRVVAVVDDERAICDSLEMLLRAAGYEPHTFPAAEAFLRAPIADFSCAIVDLRLRGMSGLELQAELALRAATLPIIVITAHGDVASARTALLAGAIDFLEKPIDNDELLAAVRGAVASGDQLQQTRVADARARALLGTLTGREREVFDRVVDGMHNREIAVDLGISPRTVEVYRAHVMAKLQARRLADLLRLRPLDSPAVRNTSIGNT